MNARDRMKYLHDENNWTLISEIREIHLRVYAMHLPNGETLIMNAYDTVLDGKLISCCEYRMLYKDGISVPWRECEVLDYLKAIKL